MVARTCLDVMLYVHCLYCYETQRVHFEVRIESLHMFTVNFALIGFPLSVSFYQRFSLIFIYVFLLLEEENGTTWENTNQQHCLGNQVVFDTKVLARFFSLKRF
jgi:hypothetical protein